MDQQLTLRIILENPPSGIDFGLQSGNGNNYITVQRQRSGINDLNFEFEIKVKKTVEGKPNFLGPYAQGTIDDRFVYIDIGTYAGHSDSVWGRRLKVPLKSISWADIEQATTGANKILETRVPGTARDGSPTCATVKPFGGWYVKDV
ncbi:MAG TPA: DUF5990 family protein [Mucilaginibacter sp.]|nr:DUF5990 family protein [Mucilaginibacter sp.]